MWTAAGSSDRLKIPPTFIRWNDCGFSRGAADFPRLLPVGTTGRADGTFIPPASLGRRCETAVANSKPGLETANNPIFCSISGADDVYARVRPDGIYYSTLTVADAW